MNVSSIYEKDISNCDIKLFVIRYLIGTKIFIFKLFYS